MKTLFIILSMLLYLNGFTQNKKENGYAYIAMGGFLSNTYGNNIYPSIGMGLKDKSVSLGAAFYYHSDYKMSLHADFRGFIGQKKGASPFISIQPGISLYRNNVSAGNINIHQKGAFALNALVGITSSDKKKGPTPYMSIGYGRINVNTIISSKTNSQKIEGLIVLIGLKL